MYINIYTCNIIHSFQRFDKRINMYTYTYIYTEYTEICKPTYIYICTHTFIYNCYQYADSIAAVQE